MLTIRYWFYAICWSMAFTAQAEVVDRVDNRPVSVEHYKYFGELPKAKKVRVINPYGSITSRNTSYDTIELSGIIQKIGEPGAKHDIEIKDNQGVTEVVIRYPQGNQDAKGRLTGRFDIGVWVPAYVDVELITDFGDIKVKNSASNIIANSNSGKIRVSSSGTVAAHSYSGDVKIELQQASTIKTPAKLFRQRQASVSTQTNTISRSDDLAATDVVLTKSIQQ